MKVQRALISVHDKTGIVAFARALAALGIEIVSTGGTAGLLREAGMAVRDVAEVTGFPEMLDGRVKTLHPRVHAGILARRDRAAHMEALETHAIGPIDLVVVALYPFEATVARAEVTVEEAIEQIDVGGPAMIRAAAKNHAAVGVVTNPAQYDRLLEELRATGTLTAETRVRLAREAFGRTAEYDAAIAAHLGTIEAGDETPPAAGPFPRRLALRGERLAVLRYGENPHQEAAFYRPTDEPPSGLAALEQLHGPELSYNNLLDFSAALALLREFQDPAAVVIKHGNPCGVALGATVGAAVIKAKASDPVSIYGGIVGVNRRVDAEVVAALAGVFLEILFAPEYEEAALDELRRTKKKARVVRLADDRPQPGAPIVEYRSVVGGLLAQTADGRDVDEAALRTASRRAPTSEEMAALRFAWRVVKHAKSNAIVLATGDHVVGVGAGQMNRVDAARLAVLRAREAGLPTVGTVCASDAFFPFRDALDVVAAAGATAAIHPGGSLRDADVAAAADERGMALVLTGLRHFRH